MRDSERSGGLVCLTLRNGVIRVYDEAGNVIETHEHAGESSTYHKIRFNPDNNR